MIKINDFVIKDVADGYYEISYNNISIFIVHDLSLAKSLCNLFVAFIGFYEYCELLKSSEDNK